MFGLVPFPHLSFVGWGLGGLLVWPRPAVKTFVPSHVLPVGWGLWSSSPCLWCGVCRLAWVLDLSASWCPPSSHAAMLCELLSNCVIRAGGQCSLQRYGCYRNTSANCLYFEDSVGFKGGSIYIYMLAPPPKTNLEFPKFPNSLPYVLDSLNSLIPYPMCRI